MLVFAECTTLLGHATSPMAEDVLAVAFPPPCTVTMQVARQLAPAVSVHSFLPRQGRVCHLWLQKEWEQSAKKEGRKPSGGGNKSKLVTRNTQSICALLLN